MSLNALTTKQQITWKTW